MNIYKEIKRNFPDLEKAELTYTYIMSRHEAQEKVEKLEKELGGLVIYYELVGKKLTLYYSPQLLQEWSGTNTGKKVRLIGSQRKGEVTSKADVAEHSISTSPATETSGE